MPVKRKKKEIQNDPWEIFEKFEEDNNFLLVIEGEDSFGNKKRMHMDGHMNLVPIESEKENVSPNISDEKKKSETKSKKITTLASKKHEGSGDEIIFKPPIVSSKRQEMNSVKTPLKGILKKHNKNLESTPILKVDSPSDAMMFSSPIIGYTPSGKRQLQENKEKLMEKLKNCQETPILSLNSKNNKIDYSLEYLKSVSNNSSDNSKSSPINEKNLTTEHFDKSSVLFPDASLLETSTSNSKSLEISANEIQSEEKQFVSDVSFKIITTEDRKRWLQSAKRRSRLIKRHQGLTDSFWNIYHVEDSLSIILKLCQVPEVQTFAKIFPPKTRKEIIKLGEGSFGEVFILKDLAGEDVVVKFIPVEKDSESEYNGAPMNKYDDVLSEIVIAKELADLSLGKLNRCKNFVQMSSSNSVSVARGRFPSYFQTEWDKSNKRKRSENDNPKDLGSHQDWIILQFHFAGCPLEDFAVSNWMEGYSILAQVALSLACAENYCEFEHRDLHLGNVLVMRTGDDEEEEETFMVGGEAISVRLHGVRATIIDFTFSRMNTGGNVVYIDLSRDKELFLGTGDIQFDVYRAMQAHNGDSWYGFMPRTNVLWLHFLGTKIKEMVTLVGGDGDHQRGHFERLHAAILDSDSASDLTSWMSCNIDL